MEIDGEVLQDKALDSFSQADQWVKEREIFAVVFFFSHLSWRSNCFGKRPDYLPGPLGKNEGKAHSPLVDFEEQFTTSPFWAESTPNQGKAFKPPWHNRS